MLIFGSRAIAYYFPDYKYKDIDVLGTEDDIVSLIDNENFKLKVRNKYGAILQTTDGEMVDFVVAKDPTDIALLATQIGGNKFKFAGLSFEVADLRVLRDIDLASYWSLDREKYNNSVKFIDSNTIHLGVENDSFIDSRVAENNARRATSQKNKHAFFHQYAVPEHIEHDWLHEMVVDVLARPIPAYRKFVFTDTTQNETSWNNLSEQERLDRLEEECTVLFFERWYIPYLVKKNIPFSNQLYGNIPYGIASVIKHVCVKGLRDEPAFIFTHSKLNKEKMETLLPITIKKTIDHLPKEFYNKLERALRR